MPGVDIDKPMSDDEIDIEVEKLLEKYRFMIERMIFEMTLNGADMTIRKFNRIENKVLFKLLQQMEREKRCKKT